MMISKKLMVMVLITTALCYNAAISQTTRYFDDRDRSNHNWRNADNWTTAGCEGGGGSGKPTTLDKAVICAGKTVEIKRDNAICDYIEIQPGAEVKLIPSSNRAATLTIEFNASNDSVNKGIIRLQESINGNVATLYIKTDAFTSTTTHLMKGGDSDPLEGQIIGEDETAQIVIGDGNTFHSNVTIEGMLEITEDSDTNGGGSFINGDGTDNNGATSGFGAVVANADGQLLLSVSTVGDEDNIEDHLTARWRCIGDVTLDAPTLKFSSDIDNFGVDDSLPKMYARWYVETGEVIFENRTSLNSKDIFTDGGLEMIGGTFDVGKHTDITMGVDCDLPSCSDFGIENQLYIHTSDGIDATVLVRETSEVIFLGDIIGNP